jgi:pyruvate,orthophosphate dikinase
MGKTCVCGCTEIVIDEEKGTITFPDGTVKHELDWISINGSTGAVYCDKVE